MSLVALTWAFNQQVGSSSLKLVLLKLADNFNDETGVCYPSIGYLSRHTELNEKTVRTCLKKLTFMGFLSTETRHIDGTNLTNVYRLNLGGVLPKLGGGGTPKIGRGVLPKLGDEPVIESKKEVYTAAKKSKKHGDPRVKEFILWWCQRYQQLLKDEYLIKWAIEGAIVKKLLHARSLEEIKKRAEGLLATKDNWLRQHRTIPMLLSKWNDLGQSWARDSEQEDPELPEL